jgi:hypothetical protein
MTQAPEMARPAGGPPPGATGGGPGGPPDFSKIGAMYLAGHVTGLEGREEELSRAIINVVATLSDTHPYPHETNDALVKAWLLSIQFAKDQNLLPEFCQKDIEVMRPVNTRMGQLIAATGEKEIALEAVAGWSPCHHHLAVRGTTKEPGKRTFESPFKTVLEAGQKIGQFDITEQYIHENWFIPRIEGFAKDLGVKLDVTPWREDGMITVSLGE